MIRSLARDRVEFGRVSNRWRWTLYAAAMAALAVVAMAFSEGVVWLAMAGMLFALPGAMVAALIGVAQQGRPVRERPAWAASLACWMYCAIVLAGASANARLQEREVVESMQPVVDALHRFERATGRPADTLDRLVPAYLPEVPRAAGSRYAGYEYQSEDGNWRLMVVGISFDLLSATYDSSSGAWRFSWD